jgi:hypothetical protein
MSTKKPALFIGSSKEGLAVARAIQIGLDYDCEVTLWNQGAFGLGQGTLESLVQLLNQFDFAVLVLTADDLVQSRGASSHAPRDNVLFELGLFMGGIGRDRTFVVHDRSERIKMPSDLAGVTTATFERHITGNLEAALGAAIARVATVVQKLGFRTPPAHQVVSARRVVGLPPTVMVTGGRDQANSRAFEIAYEFGRMIAEREVRLLSGVAEGVDEAFCRGAVETLQANGRDVKQVLTCYTGRGQPHRHRFGRIVESKFRSRQEGMPELVSECDIAITFGGGRNTHFIGVLALLEGRFLLPVASSGGASSDLHALVVARFDNVFGGRLEKRLFEDLADLNSSASDVARACDRLVEVLAKSA